MLKQSFLRGFKFAGFMIGAVTASVLLQSIFEYPPINETSGSQCTRLTPPGPEQISFCVSDREEGALRKEISDCGNDLQKYLNLMGSHAAGSKRAYGRALTDLDKKMTAEVAKHCGSHEREDLISRTYCYQEVLDQMEKEAELLEKKSSSSRFSRTAAQHDKLLDAYNQMTGSFDEISRWAIVSAACDKKFGSVPCHQAREWKVSDFIHVNPSAPGAG